MNARYVVETSRGGLRKYVVDNRYHHVVLTLQGPDNGRLAHAIATLLSESPTETPVAP